MESNAFKARKIPVNTCPGYKLVRKADLSPNWTSHIVRDAPLIRLAVVNNKPLRLTAVVRLAVRIRNTTSRIPFMVAEQLAVPVLLSTVFIEAHVRSIDIEAQNLELQHGVSVSIFDGKGDPSPPTMPHGRQKSREEVREETQHPIPIARWVMVPDMWQDRVRVTTASRTLYFWSPNHRSSTDTG